MTSPALKPLPYHVALAAHLRGDEPTLWQWFSSDRFSNRYIEMLRLELLKSNYRLPIEGNEPLYALATRASRALGVELPLTLYQAQDEGATANAAIAFLPDELVIILSGNIRELLTEFELLAVFGHEIAHHLLFSAEEGRYLVATRMLSWCADQPRCEISLVESNRLYGLATELFADMGAYVTTNDVFAVVSALLKISTGLKNVDAKSYMDQADEVIRKVQAGSSGITHPELYIRTKAAMAWSSEPRDENYHTALVTGPLDTKRLDILGQKKLTELTKLLIAKMIDSPKVRSERSENLELRYFPERANGGTKVPDIQLDLPSEIKRLATTSLEYLCYVILDFATVDPDLREEALPWSLGFAAEILGDDQYEGIVRKELRLTKAAVAKMRTKQRSIETAQKNA